MKPPRAAFDLFIRALHTWHRLARPMTLGVRGLVLDESGQVFLVRHSYLPGWHLPGGGVEPGETAIESLRRELREEGNLELQGRPRLHGVYFNSRHSRRDHVMVYLVLEFRRIGPRRPDWEIRDCGFFPVDSLPDGTSRATRERLREWAGTAPLSDLW